jgi:hypothetical protein
MNVPWLRVIDLLLGVIDLRYARRSRGSNRDAPPGRRMKHLEARLAGVAAEALNDVFERDRQREARIVERLEAKRLEAARERRLARVREAGDREIGRLRLVAGLALLGWVGSLFIAAMLSGAPAGPRVLVATGWVLLLGGMTAALSAQRHLASALERVTDPDRRPPDSGVAGTAAVWLLVLGLALIAIAALSV